MKNLLNKAMLTLVVFGLAIVSSFAMETDPPTEPVKTTVEMEVVTENLEKPTLIEEGYGYIDPVSGDCIYQGTLESLSNCLPTNLGVICTDFISGTNENLYYMHFDNVTQKWVCGEPLRKP